MAFKPERPTPFNDLAHLDADTIKFALMMRDGPPTDDDQWIVGLSEEERKVIEEENKKKTNERKQKPCAVKACTLRWGYRYMCLVCFTLAYPVLTYLTL